MIIGGAGTRMGAVIAALFVEGVNAFLPGVLQVFASSLGLLFVLMIIPCGVSGVIVDLRDLALRRYAAMRGIRRSSDAVEFADGGSSPAQEMPEPDLESLVELGVNDG